MGTGTLNVQLNREIIPSHIKRTNKLINVLMVLLAIWTSGALLWKLWRIFWLHKMREIPWVPEERLASQEGVC
jgi:hypothetical protein